MFEMAIISCAENDRIAIAKYLGISGLRQLRTLVLGETEIVHFHTSENGLEVVHVPYLKQTQWHKLVRLLTRRANFYRRWLQPQNEKGELYQREILSSDKKELVDISTYENPNVGIKPRR